jgi:hypothetical protein
MARGEIAHTARHREFHDVVDQTQTKSAVLLVARMATSSRNGSWRATARVLEHPELRLRKNASTPAAPAPPADEEDPFAELDKHGAAQAAPPELAPLMATCQF